MDVAEVLGDLFARVDEHVASVLSAVRSLGDDVLGWRPSAESNPAGWLLWHLVRVQDAQIAPLRGRPQVWQDEPVWAARFGLEPDPANHGYGHGPAEVAAVEPDGWEAIAGYHAAVSARTKAYVAGLVAADLDEVLDRGYDPPVTRGVRLISIVDDQIQHAGQAAYVLGLYRARLDRR